VRIVRLDGLVVSLTTGFLLSFALWFYVRSFVRSRATSNSSLFASRRDAGSSQNVLRGNAVDVGRFANERVLYDRQYHANAHPK
jgi:hypothetical protein